MGTCINDKVLFMNVYNIHRHLCTCDNFKLECDISVMNKRGYKNIYILKGFICRIWNCLKMTYYDILRNTSPFNTIN